MSCCSLWLIPVRMRFGTPSLSSSALRSWRAPLVLSNEPDSRIET